MRIYNDLSTKTYRDESGITLLEIMLTAGIMVVVFVLLFGATVNISTTRAMAEDRTIATTHISTMMEELRNTSLTQLLEYQPPDFSELSQETILIECFTVDGTAVTLPVDPDTFTGTLPNPVDVRIQIWGADHGGHAFYKTASTKVGR